MKFPHDRSAFFETKKYWDAVENFFATELKNDGEDITAQFCIPQEQNCTASIVAKSNGILAGREELEFFLEKFFGKISYTWEKNEREILEKGEKIIEFTGNARKILQLERVFLNTLSRLSGIATMTKKIAALAQPAKIAATRKTQWSYLDKKAVHIGGGLTHRMGLFDGILIKENHLIVMNLGTTPSQPPSMRGEKTQLPFGLESPPRGGGFRGSNNTNTTSKNIFFEVEIETEEEFEKIFEEFSVGAPIYSAQSQNSAEKKSGKDRDIFSLPKIIMLDNFSAEKISDLLARYEKIGKGKKFRQQNNIFLEASGGITEKNVSQYAHCAVDVISLGALTHSVVPLDFSLRVD